MTEPLKHGLPPIAQCDARLLILGSLPGEASLQADQYYAHPRNQFWELLGNLLGEQLSGQSYPQRVARLQQRRIALWDVIASARRQGSLDQHLRDVAVRDLVGFIEQFPDLRAIAFNGAAAARIGRPVLAGRKVALIDLPSSSPAHTMPIAEKLIRWSVLRASLID